MAISSRAERKLSMTNHSTPSTVGPGAYTFRDMEFSKPSFAGFSSSLARGGRSGTGGDDRDGLTPGPGAYHIMPSGTFSGIERSKVSWAGGNIRGSHGMVSSAPRIAPIYPGSTPFSASETIYTPGPGTYSLKSSLHQTSKVNRPYCCPQIHYSGLVYMIMTRKISFS